MALDLVRMLVGTSLLLYASVSDWRRREVGDWVWAVMAGGGLLLFALEMRMAEADIATYAILLPPGLLILNALRPEGRLTWAVTAALYTGAAASALALILIFPQMAPGDQALLRRAFGVLFIIILAYMFYYLGLLKGGADAKALMCIAILVPGYPDFRPLPLLPMDPMVRDILDLLFPFALSALMNAVLMLASLPILFLAVNILRGDFRWPQALLGYKAPVDRLPPFVWVLQEATDSGVAYHVFPRLRPEDVDSGALRDLGIERVWVTPQIPFLIPLTAGFLVTLLVGNLVFALLALL